MSEEQEILYTNKSNNIVTELRLVGKDGCEVNYSTLMQAIHQIEHLVGYCGDFSLMMKPREMDDDTKRY